MDKKERMRRIRALLDESQKTVVHRPTVAANDDHYPRRRAFLGRSLAAMLALAAVNSVLVAATSEPAPNLQAHIDQLDTAPQYQYQPVTHDLPPIEVKPQHI